MSQFEITYQYRDNYEEPWGTRVVYVEGSEAAEEYRAELAAEFNTRNIRVQLVAPVAKKD